MSESNLVKFWRRKVVVVSAVSAGILGADEVRRYHVLPKTICGIPPADYQPPHPKPIVAPVVVISSVGVLLPAPAVPASAAANAMSLQINGAPVSKLPRIKFFQFIPTTLQIDHCALSRIALVIRDDGHLRLSLQADQNPLIENSTALTTVQPSSTTNSLVSTMSKPPLATAPIRGLPAVRLKQTSFLKRNQFVIRLRGLGSYANPLPVPPAPASLGKPVMFATPPIEFWVQNGVPYPLDAEADLGDIRAFFDLVDRVELEFSYR
jgi:hypothetical protein